MKPALQLNVCIAGFPYGGNGATASEVPAVRHWSIETALKMRDDRRINQFWFEDFSDTPITMTRNKAVRKARERGAHLLAMIDSDQDPNLHKGEPWFRPFWDEAFNFIYERYGKGPNLVFAPYVGPSENCYVFQWESNGSRHVEAQYSLDQYTRSQAAIMSGIQEAAAGPTGLILIDLRLCDLIEPSGLPRREILERVQTGQMSVNEAMRALQEGYFYYDWNNAYAADKASTEDVVFTRNISLAGIEKLGYNPVHCAWDSWIGHYKPINLGRPKKFNADQVNETLKQAVLENARPNELIVDLANVIDPELSRLAEISRLENVVEQAMPPASNGHASNGHKSNGHTSHVRPRIQPDESVIEKPKSRPVVYGDMTTPDVGTGLWFEHGHAPAKHREALQDLVRAQAYLKDRPLRILEVGSWLGTTAMAMADAADVKVHCVDHWQGTPTDITSELAKEAGGADAIYERFKSNLGDRLNKTIFAHRKSSAEAAAMHWEPFDIIFIDADHTYEGCLADIENWWPHLRDDGVMVGHDFQCHQCPGVTKSVEECFGEEVETIGWHPQGAIWLARKRDYPNGLKAHADAQAVS